INQSVQVLNDGFRQTGISFNLIGWEYHQHGDYANARRPMDMKGWLRYGDYKTMNVYSLKRLQGKWLMGDTYFPTDLHRAPSGSRYYIADGIMIMADTLAGGTYKDYSKGVNLIHEAGHWFGLYHTFEGGCASQPNDFVADTPPSNGPNWKCDESRHTCGDQPEHDAIHNYMDYSPDECKWEFTPGQIDRMRLQYAVYR
ncbi:metalloprotease, partial [Saccharata proteae CBS 121410]